MTLYRHDKMDMQVDQALLKPIFHTGKLFYAWAGFLALVAGWGFFAWIHQIRNGLGVTGMNEPVYWGVYIINFVFFIGISHAGTL